MLSEEHCVRFCCSSPAINSNIFGVVTTPPMVVGLDVGGTKTNATLLDSKGVFLNNRMVETPSRVLEGPEAAIEAREKAIDLAIGGAGVQWEWLRVIGLDTPGPASANGVISSKGSTNFSSKEWWGFDIRTAVEDFFKLPVVYNNDANAAALYAHQCFFGEDSMRHSSVAAIVATGLARAPASNRRLIPRSSS